MYDMVTLQKAIIMEIKSLKDKIPVHSESASMYS